MAKKSEHHGGAWKVAYADFVTAMMALFMVLWISAQDQEILIATSRYFQNPFNSPLDSSMGVLSMGTGGTSADPVVEHDKTSLTEIALLNKLAREVYRLLDIEEGQSDRPVDVQITNDGLRVAVFNIGKRALFEPRSAEFTEWGRFVVQNLAWLLERNRFSVRIDGHLAAGFQPDSPDYTAWELSTDRANAMRRALQLYAVPEDRFERVTGFGDTVPVHGTSPEDAVNDRVEISLVLVEPLR